MNKLDLRDKYAILNGKRVARILNWEVSKENQTMVVSLKYYKGGKERLEAVSGNVWELK